MTPIDRSPPRSGIVTIGVLGGAVAVTSGLYSWGALVLGVLGIAGVVGSLRWGSRRGITAGAVGLFSASVLAGINGSPVVVTVGCVVGTIVVWDVSRVLWGLGVQLGRTAPSKGVIMVRTGVSVLVGIVALLGGYLVFVVVTAPLSPAALIVLVIAIVLLVVGVSREVPFVEG